ncbi:MAG TPA: hypothetical protein VK644_11080 [Chitinophagaceae bacterium]|nr:hypothetical protein [Chitinophagaceae bacterium]
MISRELTYEFSIGGEYYFARIKHYDQLNEEDVERHELSESSFLVHLFGTKTGFISFELYVSDDLEWQAVSSRSFDESIVHLIGNEIDSRTS